MFTVNCLRLLFTRIFYNTYFKMFYFFCKHFYYYYIIIKKIFFFIIILYGEKMETKFGKAYQRKDGYYQISSGANQGKLLHRLIYEENFGSIPNGFCIHHLDNDKNNNNPSNLILMSKSNHHKLHFNMVNNPRWGNGRIDAAGGISFLSARKNKGMTMQNIADELGYSNVSSVFHYIDKRGLRWNQL